MREGGRGERERERERERESKNGEKYDHSITTFPGLPPPNSFFSTPV